MLKYTKKRTSNRKTFFSKVVLHHLVYNISENQQHRIYYEINKEELNWSRLQSLVIDYAKIHLKSLRWRLVVCEVGCTPLTSGLLLEHPEILIGDKMAGVITKFVTASLFMWIAPVAILYCYNNNLIPGSSDLSPHTLTLLSGFLAVVSVNIVIAFYIYMAMKEPSDKHEPDPAFLAEAKASINQSTADAGSSSQSSKKEE